MRLYCDSPYESVPSWYCFNEIFLLSKSLPTLPLTTTVRCFLVLFPFCCQLSLPRLAFKLRFNYVFSQQLFPGFASSSSSSFASTGWAGPAAARRVRVYFRRSDELGFPASKEWGRRTKMCRFAWGAHPPYPDRTLSQNQAWSCFVTPPPDDVKHLYM